MKQYNTMKSLNLKLTAEDKAKFRESKEQYVSDRLVSKGVLSTLSNSQYVMELINHYLKYTKKIGEQIDD